MSVEGSEVAGCFESRGDGDFVLQRDLTFATVNEILTQSLPLFSGQTSISVDLEQVGESDSAGLALLIEWVSWANENDCDIRFENIPQQLKTIAEISEVSGLISAQ